MDEEPTKERSVEGEEKEERSEDLIEKSSNWKIGDLFSISHSKAIQLEE